MEYRANGRLHWNVVVAAAEPISFSELLTLDQE